MRTFKALAVAVALLGTPATAVADTITVGTTDPVRTLDPAGAYDLGSQQLIGNLYQNLLTIPPGGNQPKPDAAKRCGFKNAKTYVCTLRGGLRFSDGSRLTAADVKFSLDRVRRIADPAGPSTLLYNLARVDVTGARTVTMRLRHADGSWPAVLTHTLGAIVPKRVFPATRLLADRKAIGSGPYKLDRYTPNRQAVLSRNARHAGAKAKTATVVVKRFATGTDLKVAIERGDIDVAFRGLSPADIAELRTQAGVQVLEGPGSEIHYLIFDQHKAPADSLAVRQAIAQVLDRPALASTVYADTVAPLHSLLPAGIFGSRPAFQTTYGAPNVANAQATLAGAGITTPVALDAWYTPTHYGPEEPALMNEVRRQLEASGLFAVNLGAQEWEAYKSAAFDRHAYAVYSLGWFADYPDGDDYLSPFLRNGGGFTQNGYENPAADQLIARELASTKPAERAGILGRLQDVVARDVPVLPLWERKQVVAVRTGVAGVERTFDASLQLRLALLSKR